MKSTIIKRTFLALSLGFALSGFISSTAIAGPALSCIELEERCQFGDQSACRQYQRYCGSLAPLT